MRPPRGECHVTYGVAFAPPNPVEQFVQGLEHHLNGPYSEDNPWLRNDIKLICQRIDERVERPDRRS